MCQKVRVWWISVYAFELMYYVVYSVTKYYPPEYAYCVFEYTFNSYYVTLKEKIQYVGTFNEGMFYLSR